MHGPARHASWEELERMVGREVGVSAWLHMGQQRIDGFADVTEDHYFLHVDPERAADSPLGGTVAHGLLTLALLAPMGYEVCPQVAGARHLLNYGFDRIRFVAPVPAGSRVRGRFVLREAQRPADNQAQLVYDVTVEIEGRTKPALVASWLVRHVF